VVRHGPSGNKKTNKRKELSQRLYLYVQKKKQFKQNELELHTTQVCVELLKITFLAYINQGIHTRSQGLVNFAAIQEGQV